MKNYNSGSVPLEALLKLDRQNAIKAAFEAFQRREPLSDERLLEAIREFAYRKLYRLEHEFKTLGTTKTVDDWTQEVTTTFWKLMRAPGNLQRFTPDSFYAFLNRTVFNQRIDFFNYLAEERDTKVPLFVSKEDSESDSWEEENPALQRRLDDKDESTVSIPEEIRGIDLEICLLIRSGYRYSQVARSLRMTEAAVQLRMSRLRKRMERISADKAVKLVLEAEKRRAVDQLRSKGHWRALADLYAGQQSSDHPRKSDSCDAVAA